MTKSMAYSMVVNGEYERGGSVKSLSCGLVLGPRTANWKISCSNLTQTNMLHLWAHMIEFRMHCILMISTEFDMVVKLIHSLIQRFFLRNGVHRKWGYIVYYLLCPHTNNVSQDWWFECAYIISQAVADLGIANSCIVWNFRPGMAPNFRHRGGVPPCPFWRTFCTLPGRKF